MTKKNIKKDNIIQIKDINPLIEVVCLYEILSNS